MTSLKQQWRGAMQAEFERLYSMPPTELAAEVVIRGFGPGGPGADDEAATPGLEHASLVRCQMHTAMGHLDCAVTRSGRAGLTGNAAVTGLR